jgi:hypothetical protein
MAARRTSKQVASVTAERTDHGPLVSPVETLICPKEHDGNVPTVLGISPPPARHCLLLEQTAAPCDAGGPRQIKVVTSCHEIVASLTDRSSSIDLIYAELLFLRETHLLQVSLASNP